MVSPVRVGLISDTHGLLRPETAAFLRGCDLILHAGDICDASVLEALRAIAPIVAVKGNDDRGAWADGLRQSEMVEAGGIWIHVVHDIADLDIDPGAAGVSAVISGHSHKPASEDRRGVLFVKSGQRGAAPLQAADISRRALHRIGRRLPSLGRIGRGPRMSAMKHADANPSHRASRRIAAPRRRAEAACQPIEPMRWRVPRPGTRGEGGAWTFGGASCDGAASASE